MHDQTDTLDRCNLLQSVFLAAEPKHLERFAGFALGSLLRVPVRNARSGDQQGGDGGVSGVAGRSLVFEARRYGPNSRLDERSIRGQIDQAVENNPNLEAWILVTTLEVRQQIQRAMEEAALSRGIGIISFDWLPCPLPKLAVLAANFPDIFIAEFGDKYISLLEKISELPDFASTLEAIKRELHSWAIGYEAIRETSHIRVQEIWNSPRRAQAKFQQNVAGGEDSSHHVRRPALIERLYSWYKGESEDFVGALVGPEGVGKTWTALDWLQDGLVDFPIVVLVPSSALGSADPTRKDPKSIIARYLQEISGVRDVSYWKLRVERLLGRPPEEGPVFILFFDGLNQHHSLDWVGIFQQLEDDPFHESVSTLISTRTDFFEERLHALKGLISSPDRINVGNYDLTPGGEFDQKLTLEGLSRSDLSEHLIQHAVVPRLFNLIVELRDELGDVGMITVHRLLWEYGRSTIREVSAGEFSNNEWRQFLLNLAKDFREGSSSLTRQQIELWSATPTRTQDQVYRRVSGIIDSIFTTLDHDGEPHFDSNFVSHALGLALVAKLKKSDLAKEDFVTLLNQFLDPISGYDDRAEILRAAVSITLLRCDDKLAISLSNLCTCWIHSQNLPESHLNDLNILAPELVTPLLDVIESSSGHSLAAPRENAIAALSTVDKSDTEIAKTIAKRGTKWLSLVSINIWENESDRSEHSIHNQTRKRLEKRIGVADPCTVNILGRQFQILEFKEDDLIIAAAQLLQNRPLKDAIDFFVYGAIHTALVRNISVEDTQSWLNVLNTIDPEETAVGLRIASKTIRSTLPQVGHHPDFNARIGSLLLWRTGYSSDAEEAWRTDPKIDHLNLYETDYLPDPSRSFFRLERNDSARVLCDTSVSIVYRIERAKDALLDPNFQIPNKFKDELFSFADNFQMSQVGTERNRNIQWDELSLALARCNPDYLANWERERIRLYPERPSGQRLGSALSARESMLLVRNEESMAIQALRKRVSDASNKEEHSIGTNFLIAEIQPLASVNQIMKVLESELDGLDSYLCRSCHSPSRNELDCLVQLYRDDQLMLGRLATILAENELDLSDRAFDLFSALLFNNSSGNTPAGAWILLATNNPERLGEELENSDWCWSYTKSHVENMMGSDAIAAYNRGNHFSEFARRIAPARLLSALSQGERLQEDVVSAVERISASLLQYDDNAPEPGLVIYHDQVMASTGKYEFTIGDIVEQHDDIKNFLSLVERMNHPEKYTQRRHEIFKSYREGIKKARQSGAQLLHCHFEHEEFNLVLDLYPEALEKWLEGMEQPTDEFKRRVRLAEGFYVALCEAVLKRDPTRGIQLWRTLRLCLTVKFIGRMRIDRLKYAPFIAPSCPEVDSLLEDLYAIDEAQTDKDLLDIVISARISERIDWLRQMVSQDEKSACPACQRRSVFLKPLLTIPSIADDSDWPCGEPIGGHQFIHEHSWIMGQKEAFARHWLQKFAETDRTELAHAYWLLFLACSDIRVKTWMMDVYKQHKFTNGFIETVKERFFIDQRHRLEQAISKNENSLQKKFSLRNTTSCLLPWSIV